ncbi:MAG TPA: hypothetical protein PK370_00740, partial [Candidatus Woesebacteria bacterium]|nr:hypothetical protein [Candidatus Woesebacteria bacterium]
MDLNKVSSFSSLSVSSTIPGDSQIIVNTRTSSDRINWSSWSAVSGGVIASQANRYLQIGVTMMATTDRSQTPEITEIKVNYVNSQDTPVAPNVFGGMSQSVNGIGLTSGNSYPYISPYFNWSGASDDDGIKGYYVYFGTSNSADPQTEGSYQINNTYLVATPMSTGTYYLRVRSVDEFDNVSSAVTGFIYQYNGISPPDELIIDTNENFGAGTTSNVTIADGLMKLKAKAGFFKDERLTMTPQLVYNGADMDYVASSGKFYVIFGNNLNRFYEYNVALDLWSTLANAPAGFNAGAGIVAGPSGYLYAARGNNTKNFWRYEISTNTWSDTAAAETPQEMYYGGSLVYDGSRYIYALKGNADDTFMRYDTQEDSWVTLANVDFGQPEFQPNNVIGYGGDLAMDRENSLVYAIQGNLRGGFGYYDIESQSWNRLGNLPALAYYGARIELDSANGYMYYFSGWDKPYWYKYDLDEQIWTEMPEVPTTVGYGGTVRLVNNKLYLLRGANTNLFYKYDLNKNTWFVPTVGLFGTWYRGTNSRNYGSGADIVKGDGENYYILRGNYDNILARYNSTTGEMESLADAPAGFFDGTEMTYDSVRNKLFVTGSNYFNRLFSYDIATNNWSEAVGSSMPTDSGAGTAIAFDGGNSIYRIRGASTTTFDKYNILTGLWSTLPAAPGTMGYGGDMVIRNDYAYVVRGNGTTNFYRFGPLSIGGTWSDAAVTDLPTGQTIGQDGFLVDVGNDNLVACRGLVTNTCLMYSITNNSWSTMPSAPANISVGGAGASNGSNEMLFIVGSGGTNTYNMGVYKYVVASSSSSVEESGSWISPSYDLGSIYRWSGLEVTYNQATNNSLKVYTRTSDDNSEWDEWVETSDYRISSEKRRYIQIKVVMTSGDGIFSGSVDKIKLSYYTDEVPPVNPIINGYLSIGGTELISGNWGNSTAPYFGWSGAGDTGAGVAGYYVYFGTGETAAPENLGTFTTGVQMVGSGLTLGQTYYFRMKTVDDAGNTSSEVGTTYVYKFDNKAPTNPLAVLADPPGYTTNTTYKFTWDGGSDDDSGVKEYCYKTGATEGEWASDQCVVGVGITGVEGVPKYKSDENIFYLRVKDNAGNTAVSYQTAVYKHSGSAPSAPRNVRVSYPSSSNQNTENDFAFAWDTPESYLGNPSNMTYYYSINEEPTPSNVTRVGADVRFLSRGQYATRKGVNTLYVVVSDEAGNIKVTNGKYDNYGSVDF